MSAWRVSVGDAVLPVAVRRSRRRTIALHLHPGPRLELRAPVTCGDAELRRFLDARRNWVARHLAELPPPTPVPRFRDGDAHPYLGRDYTLRVCASARRRVALVEGVLEVALPAPQREDHVASALAGWQRERAGEVFGKRLAWWRDEVLRDWRLPPATLRLRRMKRRWGSCSRAGVITLNTRLIERSLALADLVIAHELCHLLEFSHSPAFYRLMDAALPDWRRRSRALDGGRLALD